jgi:hypothetical protein
MLGIIEFNAVNRKAGGYPESDRDKFWVGGALPRLD